MKQSLSFLRLPLCLLMFAVVAGCGGNSRTLIYGGGQTQFGPQDLYADFSQPAGGCAAPRPTILYIHGGGFVDGNRRAPRLARHFTGEGFNFMTISYRLAGDAPVASPAYRRINPDYRRAMPESVSAAIVEAAFAAFEDTVTALNWLETNAACHAAGQTILLGQSAGAITALNVAYALDEAGISRPPIAAVMSDCGGFYDRGTLDRGEAPLFMVHGTADLVVPFSEAETIYAEARAAGVPAHFHAFTDHGHCFDYWEAEVDGRPLADLMVDFARDAVLGRNILTQRTSN